MDIAEHPIDPEPLDRARWRWLFLLFAAVPLIVWWVAWYPGILSNESLTQLAEVDSADFTNEIPAIHSILVWIITRIWDSPAAVTLVQVAAMVALLRAYTRRSPGVGVPWWLGGITILVFGWLPAVGATTIALEVQVAQTLIAIWVLVELMALAPDSARYLRDRRAMARMSTALGMAWLFDHAGLVVVVLVFGVLALGFRRSVGLLAAPVAGAVALFLLVQGPLYAAFSVDRAVTPIGEAYAPEVAAVYHHDAGWFSEADLGLLAAVADLEVWDAAYTCPDGASLVGDREFDASVIRAAPGAYRGLLLRAAKSHPATVAGHRWCAAGVLLVPGQPHGERFSTYVYIIPPNDMGIVRDSLWVPGFNATKAILVRIDRPDRLWMYWRAGTLVWPALAGIAVLAVRRRHLAWPGLALLAFLVLAVLTVREPSFRESFTLYSLSFLSLPLWWSAFRESTTRGTGPPGGEPVSDSW